MKKIGIDARLYSKTGVGTYLKNLLFYLDQKTLNDLIFYIYLSPEDFDKVKFNNPNLVKRLAPFRWHSVGEQFGFLVQLLSDNLTLMHFTYFSYPMFYWRKFIATVHDVTPLLFRTGKASTKNGLIYKIKHYFFKMILKTQVERSAAIIAPTRTVKRQLIQIYGKKIAGKTTTIYEGVSYKIVEAKANEKLSKKYDNFFIYVGNFYPHKNVEKLIKAFPKVRRGYKLVLIGPDDYFTDRLERHLKKTDGLRAKVMLIKNPSTSDLIFFYKNAQAIIQPSLSEGFGLPLVEAAYFNRPIIASNIEVFKELWGDQYIAFDPKNYKDIYGKINAFIDSQKKFDYSKKLSRYSFRKMTDETLKIYFKI